IDMPDTDLVRIFRNFEVDTSRLLRDLTQVLDALPRGNQRTPTLALKIDQLIRAAWVTASVQYQAQHVRSGTLLLALLDDPELGRQARDSSRELGKIKLDLLQPNLMALVAGSTEDEAIGSADVRGSTAPAQRPGGISQTPALDQFTVNLTDRAK